MHQTQLKLDKIDEASKTLEQAKKQFPENKKLIKYLSELKEN